MRVSSSLTIRTTKFFNSVTIFISMKKRIKQLLRENLDNINEIGNLSYYPPYIKEGGFNIIKYGDDYEISFDEESGYDVKIDFIDLVSNKKTYVLAFSVGNNMIQKFKTTTKAYFKILSTVGEALLQFLSEYEPFLIIINGQDKEGSKGQKDFIYKNIVENNKSRLNEKGYAFEVGPTSVKIFKEEKNDNL
jgi:hypothetical protein